MTAIELPNDIKALKDLVLEKHQQMLDRDARIVAREAQPEALQKAHEESVETEEITYTRQKGHGRKPLPDDLPTEDVHYPLEDSDCPCCGDAMR